MEKCKQKYNYNCHEAERKRNDLMDEIQENIIMEWNQIGYIKYRNKIQQGTIK